MKVTLPQLYQKQHDAFFNDAKIAVCEATTKGGKTVGALAWQASQIMYDQFQLNHWWGAPWYQTANIAYTRAKRMFDGVYQRSHDTERWLKFYNGSFWWFKSAEKPDTWYGEDVGSGTLDEYTRMREEAFHALMSTLTATEGRLRAIGNVKGRGWGFTLAREAERGVDGMIYTKITADDAIAAGVLTREQVDFARRRLPHNIFRELYYCEPSDDGGNPFGVQAIEECVGEASAEQTVAYGVDLAQTQDYTAVIGFDRHRRWTFVDHFQMDWRSTKQRLISIIGKTPAMVDATGVGSPVVQDLQAECPYVEGFVFTPTSKQLLMENVRNFIQDRACTIPDGVWKDEMMSFEYHETRTGVKYSAPDRLHDDCVMAIGLGLKAVADMPMLSPVFVSKPATDRRLESFLMGNGDRSRSPFGR